MAGREYRTVRALERGEVINLNGLFLIQDEGDIQPGDMYVAERSTGPKFLTAKKLGESCIHPTSIDYSFDTWECVKVREATQGEIDHQPPFVPPEGT